MNPVSVLDKLAAVLDQGGEPAFIGTRACQEYRLRAVRSGGALLAIPLRGAKRVHAGSAAWCVEPGSALLVCRDCCFDNENIPDPASGDFLAAVLSLPDKILSAARALIEAEVFPAGTGEPIQTVSLQAFSSELDRYLLQCREAEPLRLRHALLGLVLRLYEQGHHALLQPSRPRLSDRIRERVAADPARDWRSSELESIFALSGASLRRQLALEHTSLREILAELRLSQALFLLQTTRLPIKTVAQRAGYSSVSSFVRRFHARYGVEPSRVSFA